MQSQESRLLKDPPVNFSLQAGAIIPSSVFRVRPNEGSADGIDYLITPYAGLQFGGIATFKLNRSFQIHGGLTLQRRNFQYSTRFQEITRQLDMRMTLYELPVLLMYYQRLSPQLLLTVGTGLHLQSMLSDLGVKTSDFEVLALYRYFSSPASLTLAGVEYRRAGKGGYFLGLCYNVTPFPLYDTTFRSVFDGQEYFARIPHFGDYFGIVARYYLD